MTLKADFFKKNGIIDKLPEEETQSSDLMNSVLNEAPKSVYGKHHQHSKRVHHKHLRNNCLFNKKEAIRADEQSNVSLANAAITKFIK